jgi:hypothetical protein
VGNIETKRRFKNYQITLSTRFPTNITGSGQARGNSGVFLASTGPGDDGYELQILDSYNNTTYVNGQAASIYKQSAPLVNPESQAGRMADLRRGVDRADIQRRRLTEDSGLCHGFFNGVLVQNHFELKGPDALHRQALLQEVRHRADQAAGTRRQERATQLQEHLGSLRDAL